MLMVDILLFKIYERQVSVSNMSKYFFLALLWTLISAEIDYCSIKCEHEGNKISQIVCERGKECSLPAFGCFNFQNTTITSLEQTLIIAAHNRVRNATALGDTAFSLNGITASNMNELKWDEELANIALCWVNTCGQYSEEEGICFDTLSGKCGYNVAFKSISIPSPEMGAPQTLVQHMHGWYTEVSGFAISSLKAFPDENSFQWRFKHFSQMIWAETTSVGCARSIYGQYISMFGCIYRPAGNVVGRPVFKEGPVCSACELGPCSKNYPGLCSVTEEKSKSTYSTTTKGIKSSPTTSTVQSTHLPVKKTIKMSSSNGKNTLTFSTPRATTLDSKEENDIWTNSVPVPVAEGQRKKEHTVMIRNKSSEPVIETVRKSSGSNKRQIVGNVLLVTIMHLFGVKEIVIPYLCLNL